MKLYWSLVMYMLRRYSNDFKVKKEVTILTVKVFDQNGLSNLLYIFPSSNYIPIVYKINRDNVSKITATLSDQKNTLQNKR